MVDYCAQTLDLTFAALADPTRRSMLASLAERGELAASDLAHPFAISLQAVLKHVKILADAGLIKREKRGRTVHCLLQAGPMQDAKQWLDDTEKFWSGRLEALAEFVEAEPCRTDPDQQPTESQVSNSNATSRRRSNASSRRGPTGTR